MRIARDLSRKGVNSSATRVGFDPEQAAVIVPAMTNHLADPNGANRHMAALVPGQIGLEVRKTMPTLLSGMTDSSLWVRQYCAYAVLKVGRQEETTRRHGAD